MSKNFLKKLGKAKKAFSKARSVKAGGNDMVLVSPGRRIVRLQSVKFDVNKNDVPYVMFNTVCVSSDNEGDIGQPAKAMINIESRSGTSKAGKEYSISEQDCFERICKNFQNFGYDTDDLDLEDLVELAEQVAEDQHAAQITIKDSNGFLNLYVNKFVEDENLPSIEDVVEESDDVPFDDDEEDEDDDDDLVDDDEEESDDDDEYEDAEDEDDEDEDEDFEPAKGMSVSAKPKGTKRTSEYKVSTVSRAKQTCTLIRERDDKKFVSVPWELIEAEVEEDEDE